MNMLSLGNIELPPELQNIWICNHRDEVEFCKEKGYKYIVSKKSSLDIVKWILLKPISKLYPYIEWEQLWNLGGRVPKIHWSEGGQFHNDSNLSDYEDDDVDSSISSGERQIYGGVTVDCNVSEKEIDLTKYMSNVDIYVDIKELDRLELLPKWFSDIYNAIAYNSTSTKWKMGYNKKRKLCVGNQVPIKQLRNLIICDVSNSIPYGIAATMLTLLDTMRHKVCADLIITGGTSYFWSYHDELPSPGKLRAMIPRSNEDVMFNDILNDLKGKEYNHVISFGDNDRLGTDIDEDYVGDYSKTQMRHELYKNYLIHYKNNFLANEKYTFGQGSIKVHNVHHYHTHSLDETGYAKWVKVLNPNVKEYRNATWCKGIKKHEI